MVEVGERRRIANANAEIGKKYGVLTIIAYAGAGSRRATRVRCRCECGSEKDFGLSSLKRGDVGKKCSCSRKRSYNYVTNQPDVQRPEPIRRDLKLGDKVIRKCTFGPSAVKKQGTVIGVYPNHYLVEFELKGVFVRESYGWR